MKPPPLPEGLAPRSDNLGAVATDALTPRGQQGDSQPTDGITGQPRGLATIFSDYSAVVVARVASVVFGLGFVVLAAHALSPAGYGQLAYLTVLATLIVTVASAWTSATGPRYGREEIETRGSMVGVTWARLILTAPIFALCAAVAVTLSLGGALPHELSLAAVLVAVWFGTCLILQDHIVGALQAAGRMKLSAVSIAAQQGLALMLAAALLGLGVRASPIRLCFVLSTAAFLAAAPLARVIWRLSIWPPTFDRVLMRRMLAFSVPLLAFTFSQYIIRWVDFVVIRADGTTSKVGIYAVAYQPYSALQVIVGTTTAVLTPLFVSLRTGGRQRLIAAYSRRVVPQATFLGAVGIGLVAPLCSPLAPVLFGAPYAGAGRPLSILLVSLLFLLAASMVAPILVLYERTRRLGVINLMAAGVNVVGDIILIGPGGLGGTGAALATCGATALLAAGYLRASANCLGEKAGLHPALLLPVFAGLLPSIVASGPAAIAVSIVAVFASAAGVLFFASPFDRRDAEFVLALDAPDAVKRLAVRTITALARPART